MQNRLALSGIPSLVPSLPRARESLRDLVEDRACWVDRFAFVAAADGEEDAVAVFELHNENLRDNAIRTLNDMVVSMDPEGAILGGRGSDSTRDDENGEADESSSHTERAGSNIVASFQIHARPATRAQSAELMQIPVQSGDAVAEKNMERQSLHLPIATPSSKNCRSDGIALTVQKSKEHGGTGTYPWRGGFILSRQICHWASAAVHRDTSIHNSDSHDDTDHFDVLFSRSKNILELGAGAAGLPSMALGRIGKMVFHQKHKALGCLVSSDGVDEIVKALQANITENELDDCIDVRHIDWNNYTQVDGETARSKEFDTIIFADCVYNDECAIALSQTVSNLLKPGGHVVGVLPDFRGGLDLFERRMMANSFIPINIPIVATEYLGFACSGGSGKDYRLILWSDSGDGTR